MHRNRVFRSVVVLALPLLLTACGKDAPAKSRAPLPAKSAAPAGPASVRVVQPPEAVALIARAGTVVLDVRTPAEFATGHVAGARNLDINGSGFDAEITALPRDASYVVYCHSGNRSGAAVKIMQGKGFLQVADAGGLAPLIAAGVTMRTH